MHNTLFVLVVVPDGAGRYLVVQERDGTWYLPAGKVEPGENLMAAALRETAEEAGVMVGLRGIVGIDHTWIDGRGRLRFCFAGFVALATGPKSRADEHTLGARFVSRAEIATLPLRHPEVLDWIDAHDGERPWLPCASYAWHGSDRHRWHARLG